MLAPAEMRVIDRNAEWMGVKVLDLMENAGRAVADAVLKEFAAKGKKVVIVCGPGNNGGDGLPAARDLKPQREASLLPPRPPPRPGPAPALAAHQQATGAVPPRGPPAGAADALRTPDR